MELNQAQIVPKLKVKSPKTPNFRQMHYPTFAGISSKKNPEYARDLSLQKAMRSDLLFGVKGMEGIGVELFDRDAKVSRQLRVKGGFEEQLEVPHVGVLSV